MDLPHSIKNLLLTPLFALFSCFAFAGNATLGINQVTENTDQELAEFFFIQISDTHAYNKKSDYLEFSSRKVPWYIPDLLVDYLTVSLLKEGYGEDAIDRLRDVLRPIFNDGDLDNMWDISVYQAYSAEMSKEDSALGELNDIIQKALAEVVGFEPEFVINTGDLVLESNSASAEAVDRWFKYYLSITEPLQPTFYNTIGNNDIAGTERTDFTSDDPQFGKYFFNNYFGPTHYSFNYGDFHFVALDTHSPDPKEDNPDYWNFGKMEPDVSAWVKADLEAHQDQTLVVLNHEPFHFDPIWPFKDNGTTSDDEGLFDEFGVDYVLSGHTHYRSYMEINNIHHITTGALSGLRWVLPANIHPRGYRFFYAKDRFLYSAWKPSGQPILALAEPQPVNRRLKVITAADATGAFDEVEIRYDGQPLQIERWGDYFFQITLPVGEPDMVQVIATRADGSQVTKDLQL